MKKPSIQKEKGRAANAAPPEAERPSQGTRRNFAAKQRAAQLAAPGSRAAVVAMLRNRNRNRDRHVRLHAPKEHTPPERRARLLQLLRDHKGNAADTQARRVLLALEGGPATTIELRRYLDVMQVSTRIHELRSDGHQIDTVWVQQETDAGKPHRVALYVLRVKGR